jgi:cell wall-associated NlpC family hydrolase
MMGEQYGWGGEDGRRDCSSMTKDYFSVFGVWLPRNSGDQARSGALIPLGNTPPGGRPGVIVSGGVPYATLIHMPGHIMLYAGLYDGAPVVFHNTWGVRVKSGRAVVGKAVVSGLRLGEELPGKAPDSLLIDRIDSLVFPIANVKIK